MFFPYKQKESKKTELLQVQNPKVVLFYLNKNDKERTSLSTSYDRNAKASITVEAALVLPLFLFALIGILCFLVVMSIQTRLNIALLEVGRESARYAFTYDQIMELSSKEEEELRGNLESGIGSLLINGFSTIYASEQIKERVGRDWLTNTYIKGGKNGIHLIGSDFLGKDDVIDFKLRYQIEIPFYVEGWNRLVFIQRCRVKAWTGFYIPTDGEDSNVIEEMVYITESGTVYHDNPNCTHLNLSIKNVDFNKIKDLRNQSGGKYYSCEICIKNNIGGNLVYITNTGTRYHSSIGCSGLKRGVKTVSISEVSDRRLCKRCGEKQGGN